jgi:hypothetical protein
MTRVPDTFMILTGVTYGNDRRRNKHVHEVEQNRSGATPGVVGQETRVRHSSNAGSMFPEIHCLLLTASVV